MAITSITVYEYGHDKKIVYYDFISHVLQTI